MVAIIEQSTVYAYDVSFQDGSAPHRANDAAGLFLAKTLEHIFDNLHFTAAWKKRQKFIIGHLK